MATAPPGPQAGKTGERTGEGRTVRPASTRPPRERGSPCLGGGRDQNNPDLSLYAFQRPMTRLQPTQPSPRAALTSERQEACRHHPHNMVCAQRKGRRCPGPSPPTMSLTSSHSGSGGKVHLPAGRPPASCWALRTGDLTHPCPCPNPLLPCPIYTALQA